MCFHDPAGIYKIAVGLITGLFLLIIGALLIFGIWQWRHGIGFFLDAGDIDDYFYGSEFPYVLDYRRNTRFVGQGFWRNLKQVLQELIQIEKERSYMDKVTSRGLGGTAGHMDSGGFAGNPDSGFTDDQFTDDEIPESSTGDAGQGHRV